MKVRKYCPKCDIYKDYNNNEDCNVCGTKLEIEDEEKEE